MRTPTLKGIKKQLDKEWSLAVRNRDANKCVMCGNTDGLQAHHWVVRKARSLNVRWHTDNGATLCYPCHIWKLHTYADMDFVLEFKSRMDQIVSPERQEVIKTLAREKADYSTEDLLRLLDGFRNARENCLTKNYA
jgi:5-methylcytosine-specific restriction endonuclease McrA